MNTLSSAYTSFIACRTLFHLATVSVELQGDAGKACEPLAALFIYLTMMTYGLFGEGRGSFMGINGIIKWNRKLTRCCWNPYEGCICLGVRLDVCFMGAERDWVGWIKLHELIREVNDPWQILLVPAAPLVLVQSLPWLCVGEKKAFYSFTLRDEMVLWFNSWGTTFSAAWSMALQMRPCETGSTVE